MDRSASRAMSPVSHPSPTVLAHFIGLKLITTGADPLQHMVDSDMTFLSSGSESDGEDDLDESPSEEESLDDTQTKITRFLPPAKKTRNTPERAELAKLCNPEGSPIYSVTGTSSVTPTVVTTPEIDHSVETGEPGEPPDDIPWRADYRHRYVDALRDQRPTH